MPREQIGKKLRFEVFKRDLFTCRYCGMKPPQVILNVDHVVAVVNGGTNEIENLVTACFGCNAGKGASVLGQLPPEPKSVTLEEQKEKFEQMKAYEEFLSEKREQVAIWISKLGYHWALRDGQNIKLPSVRVPCEFKSAARKFMRYLPPGEIMEAIDMAFERQHITCENRRFLFFCGICWRKIKSQDQNKEEPACT